MIDVHSLVKELNAQAYKEKEVLDHQIVLANDRLNQIKEENVKLQSQFNQWKMAEEQKFKNELSKRHNQLIEQENRMNVLHKDLEQRRADLLVKEERYLNVEKDRQEIGNARVEVEKMRVSAFNLMAEADRKISESKSAMAQAISRIEESKKLDEKNNIRNQEFVTREDNLKFDLKNLDMERNHLIELKDQEVVNKEEENKIALKAMEDKKYKLDKQEQEIRSKEDELRRKIVLLDTRK